MKRPVLVAHQGLGVSSCAGPGARMPLGHLSWVLTLTTIPKTRYSLLHRSMRDSNGAFTTTENACSTRLKSILWQPALSEGEPNRVVVARFYSRLGRRR